jgi:hypothetical protein
MAPSKFKLLSKLLILIEGWQQHDQVLSRSWWCWLFILGWIYKARPNLQILGIYTICSRPLNLLYCLAHLGTRISYKTTRIIQNCPTGHPAPSWNMLTSRLVNAPELLPDHYVSVQLLCASWEKQKRFEHHYLKRRKTTTNHGACDACQVLVIKGITLKGTRLIASVLTPLISQNGFGCGNTGDGEWWRAPVPGSDYAPPSWRSQSDASSLFQRAHGTLVPESSGKFRTSWLRDLTAYGRRYEILVLNNLVMSILVLSCSSTT